MTYELRRVAPLRAANVAAFVYGILTAVFALIALPVVLIAAAFAPSDETGAAGPAVAVLIVLAYPIMGVVMGWISGLLSSAIYNLIVRWTGGLLMEFAVRPADPGSEALGS